MRRGEECSNMMRLVKILNKWIIIWHGKALSSIFDIELAMIGLAFLSSILSTRPNGSGDQINLSRCFWHGAWLGHWAVNERFGLLFQLCFGIVNIGFDLALQFNSPLYHPHLYWTLVHCTNGTKPGASQASVLSMKRLRLLDGGGGKLPRVD